MRALLSVLSAAVLVLLVVAVALPLLRPMESLPWYDLGALRTGDLLLFNTCSAGSDLIKFALRTPYVHVGLVARDGRGRVFLFDTGLKGTRLRLLSRRLAAYKNEICVVRPLLYNGAGGADGAGGVNESAFRAVVRELLGQPYSYNVVPLCLSAWLGRAAPIPRRWEAPKHGRVCTELVADVYGKLGVLDLSGLDSQQLTPRDYTVGSAPLPFMAGFALGKEYRLN